MAKTKASIENKLNQEFNPLFLEVLDESHGHNVQEGAESHFKVVMAAEVFDGMSMVKRHQSVYGILSEELAGSVHALALHLYTEGEWTAREAAPESPKCMGGSKK